MTPSAQKGESLELVVLEFIKKLVAEGTLGLNSKNCQVHHKKGYFSKDRNGEIVADVSIEIIIEGAETYSMLWVWECKDYAHRVPVDDVEEFHAKLEQIGADNTKGTIISSNGFQRSALNYAISKKIGLCRLFHRDQVDWVVYYGTSRDSDSPSQSYQQELLSALTDPAFRPTLLNFYGLTSESYGSPSLDHFMEIELKALGW